MPSSAAHSEILRPDVAAVEDDEILGAAGDHDLAVQQIAEIAGIQPASGDSVSRVSSGWL